MDSPMYVLRCPGERDVRRLFCAPVDNFDNALRELLSDRDAIRDSYEVGILKFDARALVAIVENRVETCGRARAEQLVHRCS